ncbi:MAG: hypothetical protein ACOC5B_02235, partial [Myxococcota bacterium]
MLAVSIALLSCGEDEGWSTGGVTGLPGGDHELRWDGDAQVLEVARRDEVLLALPAEGILLGRVASVSD